MREGSESYAQTESDSSRSENHETHATSEESFKEVNPDVVYNAGGLRNSSIYYSRYNSARDSADLTVDDFFKQVIFSPEQLETIAKEKAIPKV